MIANLARHPGRAVTALVALAGALFAAAAALNPPKELS